MNARALTRLACFLSIPAVLCGWSHRTPTVFHARAVLDVRRADTTNAADAVRAVVTSRAVAAQALAGVTPPAEANAAALVDSVTVDEGAEPHLVRIDVADADSQRAVALADGLAEGYLRFEEARRQDRAAVVLQQLGADRQSTADAVGRAQSAAARAQAAEGVIRTLAPLASRLE